MWRGFSNQYTCTCSVDKIANLRYYRRHLASLRPRHREMHSFISHGRAFNEYGIQRQMKDVRLGTLRDSGRTIRTKRLLGRLEEGRDGGNRKETEKMNGTFNISSCAQATVSAGLPQAISGGPRPHSASPIFSRVLSLPVAHLQQCGA